MPSFTKPGVVRGAVTAVTIVLAGALLSACLGSQAARSGRYFGSWVDPFNVNDSRYVNRLGEYSLLEVYNDWKDVEPAPGQFNWTVPDTWFPYVTNRGATLKSSALVWAHNTLLHTPDYVKNMTASQLRAELKSHIQTYVSRYPQVKIWNVVNEPITFDANGNAIIRDNVFTNKLGTGWMREALVDAYQANPNATFVALNEFAPDGMNAKADRMFQHYEDQLIDAIPRDHLAVGLQMHISSCDAGLDNPSADGVLKNIQRFANLGIQVHITEMSDNVRCLPAATRFTTQAQRYHDVVSACVAVPNCRAISTWGVGDADSRAEAIRNGGTADYPMLFDENYAPKPAYNRVIDALNGR